MPRKKASVRWCSSENDRRRLRHFAFSLPCFRFLFPGFRFLRALLSRAPLPFTFSFPASRLPSPYLRHLLPAFSVFAPIFSASTPIFVVSTRLFIARKTHSANPADAHELSPRFHPIFCTIHMAENGPAIWNIPTIYVYLPSHSQKANTSSHPQVRNASQI
mgnify:CR=1 FL=1